MKILVIHQYYLGKDDPGGSRFNQFAKYWSEQGHRVTVIAGTVHYTMGEKPEKYRGRWVVEEREGSRIRVLRSYVYSRYNKSFLGRLWGYFSFALSATWAGLFRSGKQDVVLTTSPPLFVGIPGFLISRLKGIPFVFEVRDLWPESAIETGVLTQRRVIRWAYWLERFIYRSASLINVLTPAFRHALVKKGVPPEKIVMIPNGADLDIFRPGPRQNWVREQHDWGEKFVVLYMGAHGVANHLEQLLDAAEALTEFEEILLVLVGDGMEKPRLQALAKKRRLKNVQFIDSQPKSLIGDYANAADVCTAVLKKTDTFKTVYPNKVFDYMACAKPVLIAIDGVARELVQEAGAGLYVPPEDAEAFAQAVLRLYRDPVRCDAYGQCGYQYVQKHFSRESLALQYLSVLIDLVRPEERVANE